MLFNTLQDVSLATLAESFNLAFSDYVVPMHFTTPQFEEKLLRDGIQLQHSVGAFADGKLVGFILQGINSWSGKVTAYNGGTGVVPAFRGQKITQQLYNFTIPQLRVAGVEQCLLEVVQKNRVAVKTYQTIGFKVVRNLISYKGFLDESRVKALVAGIEFREVTALNPDVLTLYRDYEPSWQYNLAALERTRPFNRIIEVYDKDELIGYGVLQTNTNRVAQFAIAPAYHRQGLGLHLLRHLTQGQTLPVAVINVDEASNATLAFLKAVGLELFITQYEMVMPLKA